MTNYNAGNFRGIVIKTPEGTFGGIELMDSPLPNVGDYIVVKRDHVRDSQAKVVQRSWVYDYENRQTSPVRYIEIKTTRQEAAT